MSADALELLAASAFDLDALLDGRARRRRGPGSRLLPLASRGLRVGEVAEAEASAASRSRAEVARKRAWRAGAGSEPAPGTLSGELLLPRLQDATS